METLLLKPPAQPLYTVQPQQSHPRVSLRRVLYVKFLRWVDQASPKALKRAALSLLTTIAVCLLIVAPQLLLGLASSAVTWHHYGLLKIGVALGSISYWKVAMKLWRRLSIAPTGNQHTYHGIPIDDLASYLCE